MITATLMLCVFIRGMRCCCYLKPDQADDPDEIGDGRATRTDLDLDVTIKGDTDAPTHLSMLPLLHTQVGYNILEDLGLGSIDESRTPTLNNDIHDSSRHARNNHALSRIHRPFTEPG